MELFLHLFDFVLKPAETEQSELANERNFNNLSHNSMDQAVMGAQQDTGGKSKPIVSYRGPKIARSTHANMRFASACRDRLECILNCRLWFHPLAVLLRAQVPKRQRGHAHDDREHLGVAEGEHAGAVLLRPRRAAGDRPPDAALRPRRRLPLAAVAVLHADRRGRHHHDGEAHPVPLPAV